MSLRGTTARALSAALLMAGLAALVGCAPHTPGSPAADAQRPFAGDVPWAGAVLDGDGRTVHLQADWDHIHGFACDSPHERTTVTQTSTRVTITVLGYATPLPPNTACGGVGAALQGKTVLLSAPLGSRPLIDGSSGARRTVLTDSSIPTAHSIPAGYTAMPMTWTDEGNNERFATRIWNGPASRIGAPSTFLRLTAGIPATYFTFAGPAGPQVGTAEIRGSTAKIYESKSVDQIVSTVRWTRSNGQELTLESIGTPRTRLSIITLQAIAESVA